MNGTCAECKHHENGRCKRFPPSGRPSGWPTVQAHDWCGEFQVFPKHVSGTLTSTEPVTAKKRGRPRKNPLPATEVLQ